MFKISYSIHCSKLLLLHPFNGLFSRPTRVSRYQKGKTSLDLNEAREDEVLRWQWHQLDHIQTTCTSLQTDNHNDSSFTQLLQALPDAQPTVSKHCSEDKQISNGICKILYLIFHCSCGNKSRQSLLHFTLTQPHRHNIISTHQEMPSVW